jgi:signal transduction histidine kinase
LGLPICRDILKGLGGEISLQSESGAGATFVVWLAEDGAFEA